jgi:hypothetical protein
LLLMVSLRMYKVHNKKLVVQPLRGLDAFSAPQQKRYTYPWIELLL